MRVLTQANHPPASRDELDAWVRATWPRALVYARSLLRDRGSAEDVVQDCYCSLLRKSNDYDLLLDGVRLLMTSIYHACLKRNTRLHPVVALEHEPASVGMEPPRLALHAEMERAIRTGLASLPIEQRAAVELKALGHSLREIASILNVSESNAGVLVHRGRQALAHELAPFLENKADE